MSEIPQPHGRCSLDVADQSRKYPPSLEPFSKSARTEIDGTRGLQDVGQK